MLAVVARGLSDLGEQVVFVGGATIELYITQPGGAPPRATDDVDCIVGITSRVEYHALEERLRALGFQHPMDDPGAPLCRWKFSGIPVDVMPTDASVLGFSNRWYPEGIACPESRKLPDGQEIKVFSLPYFFASKIEAFLGRGKGDLYGSADLEDIVLIVDRAEDLLEKVRAAPEAVRAYVRENIGAFLSDELFAQSVAGHLGAAVGSGRIERALGILRGLA